MATSIMVNTLTVTSSVPNLAAALAPSQVNLQSAPRHLFLQAAQPRTYLLQMMDSMWGPLMGATKLQRPQNEESLLVMAALRTSSIPYQGLMGPLL
jgi:hypothetical protein